MKRAHIILTDDQHHILKLQAERERKSLARLVREAIDVFCKQQEHLKNRQIVALDAYKEGLISFGKLSEILDMDLMSLRSYLANREISLNAQDLREILRDAAHA
jgi:predicted HTH domain antitoxin